MRRFDLVTECERDSLTRVLTFPATEIVKSRGDDVLATGFEVALIGRLPRDQVSSEVESYVYAIRAEAEAQAKRIKELEATDAGKLLEAVNLLREAHGDLATLAFDFQDETSCYQEVTDWLKAYDESNRPDPLPFDGETPLGIDRDGGAGDDL